MSTLSAYSQDNAPQVSPSQFENLIQTAKNLVLLDVRTPEEYAQGHIPGAINIDGQNLGFVNRVTSRIPRDKEIALYCRSGHRSIDAANKLIALGYRVTDLAGGILAWQEAGLPVTNDTDDFFTTPNGKQVEILPLMHASIRIKFDGKEIEIDPVGKMGTRTVDYSKFPKADLILVTHEHYDHYDPEAIKKLTKADTIIITNERVHDMLGYGTALKNGGSLNLENGIKIEAVPAYNTTEDRLQFHPKGRDNGYILDLDGLRIYIAGDTEVIPEMKKFKNIDIAFLPCNLPYTMTPEQFIEAAKLIHPKVVYPYHFGTTDLSSITPALAPLGIDVRIRPFDP